MGRCQNYGPFLGTLNNRCRIIIGVQKGTIILTTTHIHARCDEFIQPFCVYAIYQFSASRLTNTHARSHHIPGFGIQAVGLALDTWMHVGSSPD